VTEGNGHAIDPAGEARRALQAAVAAHGTQALSNAVIVDEICRDRLGGLPGEAILIGSAARSDVPALLRERIGREGTYGAIQSVAATLAQAHALDLAASLWVVREFARALGFVASGGTQPTAREMGSGSGAGSGAGGLTDQGDAMAPGGAAPPGGSAGGGPVGGGPPGGGPVAGLTPGRPPGRWAPSRNVLGIAAAIALVAVYLGVAAAAHVSPFPAKTVASSTSQGQGQSSVGNPSPVGSPDPAPDPDPDPDPDPTPPSPFDTLLNMIPSSVQGTSNNCSNNGTAFGATAVADCTGLQGLAATAIIYYLFSDTGALSNGFSAFLTKSDFPASAQSCTTNSQFSAFITNCRDTYTSTSPATSGFVAEYVDKDNDPVIVSTDSRQLVMAVLIGTNDANLLAYWQPLQWINS